MLEEAFARVEAVLAATPDRPMLFLGAEGWHKGLLGLIAGRIAERFHLPTFVSALEPDGTATGSARSIASVDLGAVVREMRCIRVCSSKAAATPWPPASSSSGESRRTCSDFLHERLAAPVASAANSTAFH